MNNKDFQERVMAKKDCVRLFIPNDISYLEIAQKCVGETAKKFGFAGDDIAKIELAVEEAVSNVVKHAFIDAEDDGFDLICEKITRGIKIIVKEKGIPFDYEALPGYTPAGGAVKAETGGLGIFMMKKLMDEVRFFNLGSEGKEMHMIKYLTDKDILHYFPASELTVEAPCVPAAKAITEKIPYEVRLMQPRDAVEISRGAYKSHGYTFFDDRIYYPEKVVEMNSTGELVSAVAVTADNKFMGHVAMLCPKPGLKIAEMSFAFVNPEYRSQGCLTRLTEFILDVARQKGLKGNYTFSVANHPYSQKTILKYGFKDCGIQLGGSPATWTFKGIESDATQRISIVLAFKYTALPSPLTLYLPARHADIIKKLYAGIGAKNEYKKPDMDFACFTAESSVIEARVYTSEATATIAVISYGSNIIKEIKALLWELCVKQIASIAIALNMEDALTYFIAPELEKLNFFFSGILPASEVGDALLFQYVNNIAIDYDKIVAHSDDAREILDYIKTCDPHRAL